MANSDLPQSTTSASTPETASAPGTASGATVHQFGGDVGREPDGSMNPTPARVGAIILAAAAIIQAILALIFMNSDNSHSVFQWHSAIGMFTILASIIAAVFVWLTYRHQLKKGPVWHALGMVVLAIVQVGLGEAHIKLVHIIVGIAFLVGALGLLPMTFRRPRAE